MTVSKQDQTSDETQEPVFIKEALASVEKARRFQSIKQIVIAIFAFMAAFWLASKPRSPELNVECTVIIFVGLIAGVCTAKIMSLINKNTQAILRAIADLHQS